MSNLLISDQERKEILDRNPDNADIAALVTQNELLVQLIDKFDKNFDQRIFDYLAQNLSISVSQSDDYYDKPGTIRVELFLIDPETNNYREIVRGSS